MGLFSSTKKTYVSSVVYNMAGPEEDRPQYLKSVVLGSILTNSGDSNFSLGRSLTGAYMSGPGMRLRTYHQWAEKNSKLVGVPTDSFINTPEYNKSIIQGVIESRYGYPAILNWIESGRADITYWARGWLYDNDPVRAESNWVADFIEATGEVMITFPDNSFTRFTPNGYLKNSSYLYVSFSRVTDNGVWMAPSILIYRIGSGSPQLDAQFSQSGMTGRYLPYIPVRYESKFLSQSYMPDIYAEAKKAYKKALRADLDKVIDQLADNNDIGEIDFAYVSFGVLLNTKEKTGLNYIYSFFKRLMSVQQHTTADFNVWNDERATYVTQLNSWENWYELNKDKPASEQLPMPVRTPLPGMPQNTVRIRRAGTATTNYDMEMSWSGITETTGTGLAYPDAKVGESWFNLGDRENISVSIYSSLELGLFNKQTVTITKQLTANSWSRLTISNLVHKNHIYNGKSVEISAYDALTDDEESGFLVPLEYSLLKNMSLIESTQLSTCCTHLVLNSYQIVKKKWYQKGWFKVFLIIAVIVITVITGGAGAGTVGLLGANAAVGAALGFAGLAAVIAGAVANMVAAMILTKLITAASVAILGEKIGSIVAAVAAFVTLQVGSAMQAGQSFASSFSAIMDPTNLIHLTNSVGSGVAGFIQADAQSYIIKTQEALEDYKKQSEELQALYAENIGYATTFFDPMSLMSDRMNPYESMDSFLGRTLMTGSDIAEMSVDLVSNFSEITLKPQLP